jgi:hypothetical protein
VKQFQKRWGLGTISLHLSAQLKDFKRKIHISEPVAIGYRKAVPMCPKVWQRRLPSSGRDNFTTTVTSLKFP